jgi:hypothetical protein
MKIRTAFSGYHEVESLEDVLARVAQLGWAKGEDSFVVCDKGDGGFVQAAIKRPDQYIVEWCVGTDPTCPQRGLWRAQNSETLGARITRGSQEAGQFALYQGDFLTCTDVAGVFTAFWHGQPWPRHIHWRDLAPEMTGYIRAIDERHGRMSLCE